MVDTVVRGEETRSERLDMAGADTLTVRGQFVVADEDQTVRFTGPTDGARIVNRGTIGNDADEGRAIRFEEEVGDRLVAEIVNSGVIRSDDDTVQIDEAPLSAGRLRIENASGASFESNVGSALDLADAGTGFRSVVINAGILKSIESDGVKIGGFGRIENNGLIEGGDSESYIQGADAITFEDEATGEVINTKDIRGDRHGVDAGEGSNIQVVNREDGVIKGDNGSGVGSDGSATVVNYGTITGDFADAEGSDVNGSTPGAEDGGGPDGINDGDGDGVDIDFLARIDNYGVIQGLGAGGNGSDGFANTSEGIAAGGGVIRNFEGAVISGEGLGILIDDSSRGNATFLTRIVNEGEISGGSGPAIKIVSDLDDVVVNGGSISGGDGVAIRFGSGDNRLVIQDGSEIVGRSLGGAGVDMLDYQSLSSAATVSLKAGAASGTGGVGNFENVRGSAQDDRLSGDKAENLLDGGRGEDSLAGGRGEDTLVGGRGEDALAGGQGQDTLTGGRGDDVFQFTTAPGDGADVLSDFAVGQDRIELAGTVFDLDAGKLAKAAFATGDAAQDASDRIVYDKQSGALFYDADGVGGTEAMQFARVDAGLDLTRADFFVS